jgi:hypothetical protein
VAFDMDHSAHRKNDLALAPWGSVGDAWTELMFGSIAPSGSELAIEGRCAGNLLWWVQTGHVFVARARRLISRRQILWGQIAGRIIRASHEGGRKNTARTAQGDPGSGSA